MRVEHVLHQEGRVGVVDRRSLDGCVVGERVAEVKRELDVDVFQDFGDHDEPELVEGQSVVVHVEL